MRDEDDPFLAVMRFLEGGDGRLKKVGANLDAAFDALTANLFMTAYLLVCALVLLLFTSPLLISSDSVRLRDLGAFMHVSAGLLMLCHQLPYRSLIIGGIPMPVCARDVGIYAGALIGFATVFMKSKPKFLSSFRLLVLAVVPIALDGVTQTVLLLRESNNVIRLLTGLAFGFGFAAYVANKLFVRWYPRFREQVLGTWLIFADVIAVVVVLALFFGSAGRELGVEYMGPSDAVAKALEASGNPSPVWVRAYYVSSLAPVTVSVDNFYGSHRDVILDDIVSADWAKERVRVFFGNGSGDYDFGDKPSGEILEEVAGREHKFGIWAVPVLSQEPVQGDAPYIAEGPGEYFYYDALSGRLIMRTVH
jgi:uncharacterized membrane protein